MGAVSSLWGVGVSKMRTKRKQVSDLFLAKATLGSNDFIGGRPAPRLRSAPLGSAPPLGHNICYSIALHSAYIVHYMHKEAPAGRLMNRMITVD